MLLAGDVFLAGLTLRNSAAADGSKSEKKGTSEEGSYFRIDHVSFLFQPIGIVECRSITLSRVEVLKAELTVLYYTQIF